MKTVFALHFPILYILSSPWHLPTNQIEQFKTISSPVKTISQQHPENRNNSYGVQEAIAYLQNSLLCDKEWHHLKEKTHPRPPTPQAQQNRLQSDSQHPEHQQ